MMSFASVKKRLHVINLNLPKQRSTCMKSSNTPGILDFPHAYLSAKELIEDILAGGACFIFAHDLKM